MKSNHEQLIFTEDIDYSQTGTESIWGDGDQETTAYLQKMLNQGKIKGDWLNFAAGDGRYNNLLLEGADRVTVTDIDPAAIKKLVGLTPLGLKNKIKTKVQDITQAFPFDEASFDGVFNTGTLHLFPIHIIEQIVSELSRITKKGGLFVLDFATNVKRERTDGTLIGGLGDTYNSQAAETFLKTFLAAHHFKVDDLIEGKVPPEIVTSGDGTYTFTCDYWLIAARKK